MRAFRTFVRDCRARCTGHVQESTQRYGATTIVEARNRATPSPLLGRAPEDEALEEGAEMGLDSGQDVRHEKAMAGVTLRHHEFRTGRGLEFSMSRTS